MRRQCLSTRKMRSSKSILIGMTCLTLAFGSTAMAVPTLQLYLEGGTYDPGTESWFLEPDGSSSGDPFRIWTIGNVSGPGGQGAINDVFLSIAYEAVATAPTVTLTPTTTGGVGNYGGFFDPSTPLGTGAWVQTVTDGSSPTLGNGSPLPSHGIYGPGTHWQMFSLGDFALADSPMADFIDAFPDAPVNATGQINAYDISVLDGSGLILHFDLYDTIMANNHARFAPFSHDASVVPVPGAAFLGVIGLGLVGWIKRRS